MIRLVSEVETAEEHTGSSETGTIIRLVLSYADRGLWDVKVRVGDRSFSVKQIVRRWNLSRYLRQEEAL
jgi:hypothetical protein